MKRRSSSTSSAEKELEMSTPQVFVSIVKSALNLMCMLLSLFWAYLTLGWRVRKTREAFETQLLLQGMSKNDAKRLSTCYEELKKSILVAIKHGVSLRF